MMADMGMSAVKALPNEIMYHSGNDVVWHEVGKSFVGLLQPYFDKYQNSLKASSFQFYTLTLLF